MTDQKVPKISVSGLEVKSDATIPANVTDSCASWSEKDIKSARKLMKQSKQVICLDATAYAAMLAISIDLLNNGKEVKAVIVKGWQAA
jgi:hypothetical protein